MLPLQGAQVPSLVWELGSHMPHNVAKEKIPKTQEQKHIYIHTHKTGKHPHPLIIVGADLRVRPLRNGT